MKERAAFRKSPFSVARRVVVCPECNTELVMDKWPWWLREVATYILMLHVFGFLFFGRRFKALWEYKFYQVLIAVALALLVVSFFTMRVVRASANDAGASDQSTAG